MSLDEHEQHELERLEAVFDAAGGRGVDVAERIDFLRTKRDGVDVVVHLEISEVIHMDAGEFEAVVEDAVAGESGGGGGTISAWTVHVEGVEHGTTLAVRVRGDWQ